MVRLHFNPSRSASDNLLLAYLGQDITFQTQDTSRSRPGPRYDELVDSDLEKRLCLSDKAYSLQRVIAESTGDGDDLVDRVVRKARLRMKVARIVNGEPDLPEDEGSGDANNLVA